MKGANRTRTNHLAVLVAALGILASATYAADTTTLTNGVAVTGISGTAGSERMYRLDVPAGQDTLSIQTSGGTGDVDLYVRRGSQPTTTAYDYRPYKPGNEETVDVNKPAGGVWYIMLRGYAGYSNVTLLATYSASMSVKTLTNGVPVTGITGAASAEIYYSIEIPAGQTKLEIAISGGSGDADLYVKKGSLPTTTSYDYRPFLSGNNESITADNPTATTWYIMIRGYSDFAGITLLASYGGGGGGGSGTVLQNGVAVTNISGTANSEKLYRFDLPAGQTNLEIKMSGGTGDADLYVKIKDAPTTTDYDYRPFLTGNNETVTVATPTAGTWYVMIRGYSDYAGITLKATWGSTTILHDEVPVTNLSGAVDSESFFSIDVPSGQTTLDFTMSGGTGNADMYIKQGAKPTTSLWDYRPTTSGNNESISISSDMLAGTWYVMLKGTKAYDGVTLKVDYSVLETVTPLSNGVPVTNLSGIAGTQKFFSIQVPSGQTKFEIRLSGGTGDADLYVRRGAKPTLVTYDYKPDQPGNDEGVTIDNPAAGTWYILVRGHLAFSGVTLLATYGGSIPDTVVTLSNGVPVTGIGGAAGGEKFYKIVVPTGQVNLEIKMSGGTGDADLYVKKGAKPTTSDYDYRPYLTGNNETVSVDDPAAATWYIMIRGYTAFDGITLKATYTGTTPPPPETVVTLTNGVALPGQSGISGGEKFYKIDVPAGQDLLVIETSGGTGDVDLYVKRGSKPTTSSYDYRPYLVGNNETVSVDDPAAATWYLMLRGYQAYTGVTVKATYSTTTPPPPAGNIFNTDPNCVALWRMESGQLTTDSVGANTLTNQNVTASTAHKEGSSSAEFHAPGGVWEARNWLSIVDANLARGFPGKNGTANKRFTICFWVKFTTIPGGSNEWSLVTKANTEVPENSYAVRCAAGGRIVLDIGTGASKRLMFGTACRAGVWYHVGVTFNDATHTGTIRVWDDTAGAPLGTDATKTNFDALPLTRDAVVIGSVDQVWFQSLDGLMDEVVVFNDILTSAEVAKVRAQTYGH